MIKIIEDLSDDFVICPVCKRKMKYINGTHLKSHGYSSQNELLADYPNTIFRSKSVSSKISSHLKNLNSNSELQSAKAKNGWTDERRKQKSDQLRQVCYDIHSLDKYSDTRSKIYKNRFGRKSRYKLKDGSFIDFRSKLEWDICKFLETYDIEFEYESLQIRYKNPIDDRYHQYIPDFYIPKYNLVIEGKYSNEQDVDTVIAKQKAAISKGYKFMFIDENTIKNYKNLSKEIALCIE